MVVIRVTNITINASIGVEVIEQVRLISRMSHNVFAFCSKAARKHLWTRGLLENIGLHTDSDRETCLAAALSLAKFVASQP